ncbi:acyltransferase family protein [Pseudoalteromonas arctica]|uniref:Acyltransferase family protein n=1 Tax=Pseudoalteromonas arctica TaxID=394751 RepID=A0A7Y0DQ93_9GAMM|nr:acyltransferase family protein [Pseudoalteromonas arctica]NMM39535.1 acyltransferase family protein [Pseudoalteromonas arctica]
MTRINYIDNMKAIGIALVVLGHAAWLNEDIYTLIYSFHMPLFFFLSGFLASTADTTKQALIKLSQRLVLPFIFFFLVSYLFWLPLHFFGDGQASNMKWFDPLSRLITSQADSFHINGVLWFFPCLIVISLAQAIFFSSLKTIHSTMLSSVMLVIMLLNRDLISDRLFWSIDSAVIGLFFYQLGALIKKVDFFSNPLLNNKTKTYLLLFFSVLIFCYLALLNGNVDMRELQFGVFPLLYPVIACLGIFIVFLISKSIKSRAIFQLLAVSSIVIFPLHLIIFRFLHKIELKIVSSGSLLFDLLPYFNTVIAIYFLFLVFELLKKKTPRVIGL